MLKSVFKFLCIGLMALLPMLYSCKDEITPKEVQSALQKSQFEVVNYSQSMVNQNSINGTYQITPNNPGALKIKDEKVKITKVEFFFNDELISTSFNEPYEVKLQRDDLSPENTYKLYAHVYGRTNPENETFIEVDIMKFNENGYVDVYLDYNFAIPDKPFTVTACVNPEKTTNGLTLESFTAWWGSTRIGTATSAPFSLSYVVKDPADSKHDLKVEYKFSNGETYETTTSIRVCGPNMATHRNEILSRNNVFKQSDILRCKAYNYTGPDFHDRIALEVYFDGKKIGASDVFPYSYEKSLQNVSKGEHILECKWILQSPNGTEISSSSSEEKIKVI